MKRRDFLAASAVAAAGAMSGQVSGAAKPVSSKLPRGKQYIELRHYEFASEEKLNVFEAFLGEAAIPALNRQGIKPVGVFKDSEGKVEKGLWVLIPHETLESALVSNTKMVEDDKFVTAGIDVLEAPMKDPVYKRFTSSLMLGFDKCPKVEVPTTKPGRLFQLRIYESHNAVKAKRKVEMFDAGGEIKLFRETGLDPVFFGEAIVGTRMPNLTYMLGFDDAEAKDKAWGKFVKHPEWKKMSGDPYYKDTVSHITNLVLVPSEASQI